jgi:hypothetical protein
MLHEALDGAALAGRVPALEQHHQPLARVLDPVLQLQQLDLQHALGAVVLGPGHPLVVGVVLPPGLDRPAVPAQQHRVVVIVVLHLVPGQQRGIRIGHPRVVPEIGEASTNSGCPAARAARLSTCR